MMTKEIAIGESYMMVNMEYRIKLEQQNAALVEALDVFFKVVVVDGKQYRPGYPLCAGCDELTVARGMECFYKRQTTECKYPDELKAKALDLKEQRKAIKEKE